MSWPNVPVGELCEVSAGGTPSRSNNAYWGDGYKWLSIQEYSDFDIVTETAEQITEEGLRSSSAKLFPKGAVIISIFATLGRVALLGAEMSTNQAIAGLVCGPRIDNRYLMYVLKSKLSEIEKLAGGVAQKNINLSILRSLKIPLPPLATQKHIARVLEQADQLRKQAQQMESELNQLAQSLFLEMFGDLFRNPKAWPIVELSGLITRGPKNGLYKHADDYGTGSPIIRIDNFYDGELTNHSSLKRVAVTAAELDKFKIDENSILINRVNSPEYLGKAALVERLQEPTVFESNMMNFSVDTDRVNPLFLVTQLGSLYVKEQIRKASKDAVNQSSINQGDVQSFTVALPPIDYQNKFARRLSEIRLVRSMCLESKGVVEVAFNSLMQRAFNGELTAPERKAA